MWTLKIMYSKERCEKKCESKVHLHIRTFPNLPTSRNSTTEKSTMAVTIINSYEHVFCSSKRVNQEHVNNMERNGHMHKA